MVRKTSGLFVACTENAVLVLLLHFMLSGIMGFVMPFDFSPCMRGTMQSQLGLVIATVACIAVVSAWDRSRIIASRMSEYQEDSNEYEYKGTGTNPPKDAVRTQKMQGLLREWIMTRLEHHRRAESVAHAYCMISMSLLLIFLGSMLQAASGWGLSEALEFRFNEQMNLSFTSSKRQDWVQAVAGGSGWVLKEGTTMVVANPTALPLVGSIFTGVVAAFLCVSFILSLYLLLTSMPEGDSSLLIAEPRGLIVGNGILAFAGTQGVEQNFAYCNPDVAGGAILMFLFSMLACWADELPAFVGWVVSKNAKVVPSDSSRYERRVGGMMFRTIARIVILVILAWVPVCGVFISHTEGSVPMTLMVFSIVLAVVASIMSVVDVLVFSRRNQGSTSLHSAMGYALLDSTDDDAEGKAPKAGAVGEAPIQSRPVGGGNMLSGRVDKRTDPVTVVARNRFGGIKKGSSLFPVCPMDADMQASTSRTSPARARRMQPFRGFMQTQLQRPGVDDNSLSLSAEGDDAARRQRALFLLPDTSSWTGLLSDVQHGDRIKQSGNVHGKWHAA